MSRMAASGTRTSSRRRCPSGLTNVWTVTSLGMSWADTRGASRQRVATPTATGTALKRRPLRSRNLPVLSTGGPFFTPTKLYTVRRHGGWAMKRSRNVLIGSMFIALAATLGVAQHLLQQTAEAQAKNAVQA